MTDLPIQKGLSSSAAICVLVARAFNLVYDLKMSIQEEMEFAYLGEITTPSRCGRMDQACAYGNRPIAMIFDATHTDIIELIIVQGKENQQKVIEIIERDFPQMQCLKLTIYAEKSN